MSSFASEVRALGPANFLYSDGDALFAHGRAASTPRPGKSNLLASRSCNAALLAKFPGIGNHCFDAVFQEEALGQDKFRIGILFLGSIIDDGYPPRRVAPALQNPLALEPTWTSTSR